MNGLASGSSELSNGETTTLEALEGSSGPIASPQRERVPNQAGLSLSDVRDEVERTIEVLRTLGDEDVTYLDGRTLIGETEGELLDDGLHPTANGYRVIAQRVMPVLRGLDPKREAQSRRF